LRTRPARLLPSFPQWELLHLRITERIKKWRLTVPARASKNVFATIRSFAALRLLVQVENPNEKSGPRVLTDVC
jgi:hypothetical protein